MNRKPTRGEGLDVALHLVLGTTLAAPLCFVAWEMWRSIGVLRTPLLDPEQPAWRIWVPFAAMGLATALLTLRRRDRLGFWILLLLSYGGFALYTSAAAATGQR